MFRQLGALPREIPDGLPWATWRRRTDCCQVVLPAVRIERAPVVVLISRHDAAPETEKASLRSRRTTLVFRILFSDFASRRRLFRTHVFPAAVRVEQDAISLNCGRFDRSAARISSAEVLDGTNP